MSSRAMYIERIVKECFQRVSLLDRRIVKSSKGITVIRLKFLVHEQAVIEIREVWHGDKLVDYGYQLAIAERRGEGVVYTSALRYNSAPHHLEIPTFPHHKHVGDRIEPLENPRLENFLREAKQILEQHLAMQ